MWLIDKLHLFRLPTEQVDNEIAIRRKIPAKAEHEMCRERQQFLCYGKTSQLHEQDNEKAVFYHRQTDYAAAIKVSMAIVDTHQVTLQFVG